MREANIAEGPRSGQARSITRRAFMRVIGAASIAALAPIKLFPQPLPRAAEIRKPVVSFHMDRLYLDWTGKAEPYIAPAGARSAAFAAQLSDETLRSMLPCA